MRLRRGLLALPLVVLTLSLACESENEIACREYVEHFESLPCTEGLDPGVDCNAFADYPCPIPDHFSCLERAHTCDENNELQVDLRVGDTGMTCADLLDCQG